MGIADLITSAKTLVDDSRRSMAAQWTADLEDDGNDRSDLERAEAESYQAALDERYEWGGAE